MTPCHSAGVIVKHALVSYTYSLPNSDFEDGNTYTPLIEFKHNSLLY